MLLVLLLLLWRLGLLAWWSWWWLFVSPGFFFVVFIIVFVSLISLVVCRILVVCVHGQAVAASSVVGLGRSFLPATFSTAIGRRYRVHTARGPRRRRPCR